MLKSSTAHSSAAPSAADPHPQAPYSMAVRVALRVAACLLLAEAAREGVRSGSRPSGPSPVNYTKEAMDIAACAKSHVLPLEARGEAGGPRAAVCGGARRRESRGAQASGERRARADAQEGRSVRRSSSHPPLIEWARIAANCEQKLSPSALESAGGSRGSVGGRFGGVARERLDVWREGCPEVRSGIGAPGSEFGTDIGEEGRLRILITCFLAKPRRQLHQVSSESEH